MFTAIRSINYQTTATEKAAFDRNHGKVVRVDRDDESVEFAFPTKQHRDNYMRVAAQCRVQVWTLFNEE